MSATYSHSSACRLVGGSHEGLMFSSKSQSAAVDKQAVPVQILKLILLFARVQQAR